MNHGFPDKTDYYTPLESLLYIFHICYIYFFFGLFSDFFVFQVGFFPSHCVEILREKEINDQILAHLQSRPISKRRGKFINFLRFFFKSRPSKDELMQHGILRERVFGCDLGERLAHIGRDIPLVLQLCAEVIEEHGVVDGIYRLSGIMSNLQRLR